MKLHFVFFGFWAVSLLSLTSCDKEDGDGNIDPAETVESKYVVAATSGENDYLVLGDEVSATSMFDATSAEALQSPGNRIWSFYKNKVAYGFLYNQADAGTTASYVLGSDGKITKRNELALDVSIQTRGEFNGNLVLAYSDRLRDTSVPQKAYFYTVNTDTDASVLNTVVTDNLLESGEAAYFTDIAEFNGNLIAGARSISSSSFSSAHYNTTYVVVFNSDFTVKQVIKDTGRTGFVAGQKYSQGETGLEVADNGDLYIFSSGQTNYEDANTTTVPSGILKINKGGSTFDASYFFDITAASGGHNLFRTYYMGGSTFILSMYPGKNDKATFGVDADRFAVIDVATKSFKWISGIPTRAGLETDPFLIGTPFVDADENQLIVPITSSEGKHHLYALSPASASATQLSGVIGEGVKAIGRLAAK